MDFMTVRCCGGIVYILVNTGLLFIHWPEGMEGWVGLANVILYACIFFYMQNWTMDTWACYVHLCFWKFHLV